MKKQKTLDSVDWLATERPAKTDQIKEGKQQAEEAEIAGRHKNDGRNDHVGHKVLK